MIVGSEINDSGELILSYYDSQGKIKVYKKKLPKSELFNWVESNKPSPYRNWDGKFIEKKPKQGKYVSQFRIEEILQSVLSHQEKEEIYDFNTPQKTFLDIEIKLTSNEFPDPVKAEMPVGLISFCNEKNITYVLSIMENAEYPEGLKQSNIEQIEKEVNEYFRNTTPLKESDAHLFLQDFKVKHKFFKTEKEMLTFFFHQIVPKLSFVTGWNFTNFDWKYLMNRARNLKIKSTINLPSPKVFSKCSIPKHLGILDYMEVFMQSRPYKVVENYKLDYISNLVLNNQKLKHNYNSFFEFQKDIYLYTKYNIIDTILVKLIEQKLSILDVAFSMSWLAKIDVSKVYSPVYITEILICRELLSQGLKMMELPWGQKKEKGTYAGAFVKDPIPGYYEYIVCNDFASMYPNIQMQFNIGPDTYLGKADEVKRNGSEIYTKNNTLFDNTKDSVVRKIQTRLYDERVRTKKQIKELINQK